MTDHKHVFDIKILSTINDVNFTASLPNCDNASKTFQRDYPLDITKEEILKRISSDSEINQWASNVTQEYMELTSW